ncbi:hypothetical protein, partial [Prevotella corporis]|uniref:hypothetical protein n=2 Tax=Prevotella corporis TaxID=28128 RepID=UPI001B7FCB7D
ITFFQKQPERFIKDNVPFAYAFFIYLFFHYFILAKLKTERLFCFCKCNIMQIISIRQIFLMIFPEKVSFFSLYLTLQCKIIDYEPF